MCESCIFIKLYLDMTCVLLCSNIIKCCALYTHKILYHILDLKFKRIVFSILLDIVLCIIIEFKGYIIS